MSRNSGDFIIKHIETCHCWQSQAGHAALGLSPYQHQKHPRSDPIQAWHLKPGNCIHMCFLSPQEKSHWKASPQHKPWAAASLPIPGGQVEIVG